MRHHSTPVPTHYNSFGLSINFKRRPVAMHMGNDQTVSPDQQRFGATTVIAMPTVNLPNVPIELTLAYSSAILFTNVRTHV